MFRSKITRPLRKLLMTVTLVIIILVMSDWLLGRLVPYITAEPPFILHLENVPGVEALWSITEAGFNPVVFTGSSQTYSGISPHVFNERIKAISGQDVKSVDVTISGSVIAIQRDLIRNFIIPNKPQAVFYALEMRALRTDSQDEKENIAVSDFRNEALGYAISQPSEIIRDGLIGLLKHSNWIRYRDNLHEWVTGTRGINQGQYFQITIDDLGYVSSNSPFKPNPDIIQTQFIPFAASDVVQQALQDIGQNCRQTGTTCILLNMPIHEDAYQYITTQEETVYKGLIKEANLPIWDFNTSECRLIFGDDAFLDLNHLNATGAKQFTEMIADVYAKTFLASVSSNTICGTISPSF
jgi:hypothetical protein